MENVAVKTACEMAGGLTSLARQIGVSPPTVTQWSNGDRPVPTKRCVSIELITGGRVSRKELRPDDWMDHWPELARGSK